MVKMKSMTACQQSLSLRGRFLPCKKSVLSLPCSHGKSSQGRRILSSGVIGGQRILLLSDLGRPGQDALLQRTPDLRADIVITGLPV